MTAALHVAFLRGMNLGGRRVKNALLIACFEELGFGSVSAFLASGNVLFDAGELSESALEQVIETKLYDALGYPVKRSSEAKVPKLEESQSPWHTDSASSSNCQDPWANLPTDIERRVVRSIPMSSGRPSGVFFMASVLTHKIMRYRVRPTIGMSSP